MSTPEEKLDRIYEKLLDIQAEISGVTSIVDASCRRLDKLEKTVFGNGGMGLTQKFAFATGGFVVIWTILSIVIQRFIL